MDLYWERRYRSLSESNDIDPSIKSHYKSIGESMAIDLSIESDAIDPSVRVTI
jgi:hypothetical protein